MNGTTLLPGARRATSAAMSFRFMWSGHPCLLVVKASGLKGDFAIPNVMALSHGSMSFRNVSIEVVVGLDVPEPER